VISDGIAQRIIDIRDRSTRRALEAYTAGDEPELVRWLADIVCLAQEAIELTQRDRVSDARGGPGALRLVARPGSRNDSPGDDAS
jgi:hypothetical protein